MAKAELVSPPSVPRFVNLNPAFTGMAKSIMITTGTIKLKHLMAFTIKKS